MNALTAGITIDLRIGQRVLIRERFYTAHWSPEVRRTDRTQLRVGTLRRLGLEDNGDGEDCPMARAQDEHDIDIWHQTVPAAEVEILDALRELTFALKCSGVMRLGSSDDKQKALLEAFATSGKLLDRYTGREDALHEQLAEKA